MAVYGCRAEIRRWSQGPHPAPTLIAELRAHRRVQIAERLSSEIWTPGPHGGWVFANPVGGPSDPREDATQFKELCAKAGVPSKRLHDLRHSAPTSLASDLELKTAGQVLGHSQLALTLRYLHVLKDRRSVAAARIEATLFGRRTGGY